MKYLRRHIAFCTVIMPIDISLHLPNVFIYHSLKPEEKNKLSIHILWSLYIYFNIHDTFFGGFFGIHSYVHFFHFFRWSTNTNRLKFWHFYNATMPAGGRGASVSACADLTNQLQCCGVDPTCAWIKTLTQQL